MSSEGEIGGETEEHSAGAMFGFAIGAFACVVVGAIMSGLQVGYFSLDPMKLHLLQLDTDADKEDQKRARKLVPLLDKHHFLLVTLLVCNAAAMETLPILLDALVPSYVAIIMSVTLVLIAGEVIPQALCTSRPLLIGSFFAPFIKFMMVFTAPISWPMAKLLDWIIGSENGNHWLLKKTELHALVDLHSSAKGGHLESDQVAIMKGALSFGERSVHEIMTPLSKVFMIEVHRVLDHVCFYEIFQSGFSRIPVYDANLPAHDNIIGLMIVKDLLLLDPKDEMTIEQVLSFYPHTVEKVFHDTPLPQLLGVMKSGKTHMAIVHDINHEGSGDPFRENLGIVTLEDVLESIIGMEIEDESDVTEMMAGEEGEGLNTTEGGLMKTTGRSMIVERYRRRNMDQKLTPNERVAVVSQLRVLTDVFGPGGKLNEESVKKLVANAQVYDIRVKTAHSSTRLDNNNRPPSPDVALTAALPHPLAPAPELNNVDISQGGYSLYRRGEANEFFTLIIDGSAVVRAGVDGFPSDVGAWSVIGTQALKSVHSTLNSKKKSHPLQPSEGAITVLPPFVPDFTATLTSSSRVMRISRKAYLSAVRQELGLEEEDIKEAREVKGARRAQPGEREGMSDNWKQVKTITPSSTPGVEQRSIDQPNKNEPAAVYAGEVYVSDGVIEEDDNDLLAGSKDSEYYDGPEIVVDKVGKKSKR